MCNWDKPLCAAGDKYADVYGRPPWHLARLASPRKITYTLFDDTNQQHWGWEVYFPDGLIGGLLFECEFDMDSFDLWVRATRKEAGIIEAK